LSGSCLFVLLLLLFLVVIKLYMVYGAQAWPPESNSNSSCPKLVKHDQHHHAPAFSKRFRKIGRLMCDNYVHIIKQSSLLPSHRPCRRLSRCPSHRPGHRPSCCLSRRRRPRAAVRLGIAVRVAVRVAFRVKLVRPSGFNWGITARIEYRVGSQDRFAEASFLSVLEPVAGSAAGIIKLSGKLQVEKVS
jgi:hypothetical protein